MVRLPAILLVALLATVLGCKHTYEQVPVTSTGVKLRSNGTVYVATPADARFKKEIIVDSGRTAAKAIREAFARHARLAWVGRRPETRDEALSSAQGIPSTYLVYPTIVRWEDRSTENTGRRDRIELKIEVLDPLSGEVLHATVLKGTSRWFTDGGDKPDDLLTEPIEKYVASLFQPVYAPSGLP
jgi:hypothetical protein